MSKSNLPDDWRNTHPDFDGHLERPPESQSFAERLRLAWEGTVALHRLKQQRKGTIDVENGAAEFK